MKTTIKLEKPTLGQLIDTLANLNPRSMEVVRNMPISTASCANIRIDVHQGVDMNYVSLTGYDHG